MELTDGKSGSGLGKWIAIMGVIELVICLVLGANVCVARWCWLCKVQLALKLEVKGSVVAWTKDGLGSVYMQHSASLPKVANASVYEVGVQHVFDLFIARVVVLSGLY